MTTGITAALHFHSLVQAPSPDVEQARDATQKIDAVKVEDAPPEKQQSLPEMIDDFMAKSNAMDKKITEFEKDIAAHADVTADLQAAQAALATYMTEHPDLQGDIDMDEIMVYLPETSPLRTGETAEVSVRTLMNKYKVSQKGLQLPEMPKFVAVSDIGPYQTSLDRAVLKASSYFNEIKQSKLSELASRRQGLLDLMAMIIKTYSELLRSSVRR